MAIAPLPSPTWLPSELAEIEGKLAAELADADDADAKRAARSRAERAKVESHAVAARETNAAYRFISAWDPDTADPSVPQVYTRCPACQDWQGEQSDHLAIAVAAACNPTRIAAHCLRGCTPAALAEAFTSVIAEAEAEDAREEAERQAAQLAAEMDVCASPLAPQEWTIPDLIPARASTLWTGASGDGKSWLLIAAAVCVAAGIDFLGRPVRRGRVLLALLESREINERRIDSIARGLGTSRDALRGWLDLWPAALPLRTDDPQSLAELAKRVRLRGYAMIGIDNATKIRTSRSQSAENDSSVMSAVFEPLAALAQAGTINGEIVASAPPAIVTLHHAGRDGTARGSTGIQQNIDYAIEIRRKTQRRPDSPITLDLGDGCRVACEALPIAMRFRGVAPEPVIPELIERAEDDAPARSGARPRHERMLEVLRESPMKANELAAAVGGSKRDVFKVRDELAAEGLIEQRDDGRWHVVEHG